MYPGDLMDGRYRLLDRLGAGGMSVVWRAHDEVLERDVAVKVLSPDLAADPQLLHRIRSEARSVARLRHPNIVEVYDYGEATGSAGPQLPYVVMEVVEGRSLEQLLTGGALPWRLAVLICAQVAAALAVAHARGVVHRDVKPGNVMVAGGGVKLVDFGISATSGDNDAAAGQLLGTPAYLAPERLEQGAVRPATDVYALGLLLYQALAGQLPWQASTTTQMIAAHRYHQPAALPTIADLPIEVSELCRRCLDKEPGQRPPAAEVAKILGAVAGLAPATLLSDADVTASTEPVVAPTLTRAAAQAPRLAGAAASAARAFEAPLRRWRQVRHHRRIAAAAGATALLLFGFVGADMLTRGAPGDGDGASAGIPTAVVGMGERKPECVARYAVGRTVDSRFSTTVSIANTAAVPIADARMTFTFPGEQRLVHGSPGTWRQNGRSVQAQVGDLPPQRSRTVTFEATYRGVNALPDRVHLNGHGCRTVLAVAGQTTEQDDKQEKGSDKKTDEGEGEDSQKRKEKKGAR